MMMTAGALPMIRACMPKLWGLEGFDVGEPWLPDYTRQGAAAMFQAAPR